MSILSISKLNNVIYSGFIANNNKISHLDSLVKKISFNLLNHNPGQSLIHTTKSINTHLLSFNQKEFQIAIPKEKQFFQDISLPASIKEEFTSRIIGITRNPYLHYQELTKEVGQILRELLPFPVQKLCAEMNLWGTPQALLLKNCPVTIHPVSTPEEDKHDLKKGFLDELFLLGLMDILYSKAYHDRHGKYGEVIGQVIAKKESEYELSSRGSKVRFNFHTEIPQIEEPIDILTLFCIKGDPLAATEILSVDTFLKGLPQWVIEGMQRPIFEMRAGPTWTDKSGRTYPILEPDFSNGFYLRFNSDLKDRLIGVNSEAKHVVDYLRQHLESGFEFHSVILEKGDCLIINNRKVLHARNAYTPSTSWEERRWLLRGYSRLDWPRLIHNYILSKEKL
jgi:hypothetical protein